MNFPFILNLIGAVLVLLSLFMTAPVLVSAIYGEAEFLPMLLSAIITGVAGAGLYLFGKGHGKEEFRHRDVFAVVTLTWVFASLFGSIPYLMTGSMNSFTDAYFEAMAGFTTTGATILTDIEALPKGILFWRSLTQWIGGMGIILFALAVLPFLGSMGMHLFKAEVPELTVDRLRPRIIDTAKSMWYIYVSLTCAALILYLIGGMTVFDAISHAFTTTASGGFSTKNASIGHFQSAYIDVVTTVFMFLAGVNYTLYFYSMRGQVGRFWRSTEFRFYVSITLVSIVLVTLSLQGSSYTSIWDSLRYGAFQVVSIMTTTGYTTADYVLWLPFAKIMLVLLMFTGAMIGSTGGGMKQIRVLLMFRQGYRELYQLIHPRAVTSVKVDGKVLSKELLGSIWGYLFLFILICSVATLAMAALGADMVTAFSTVVSAMSNVGPALGEAGPTSNYAAFPAASKWILAFCMLAGRLEIYTVLILLVPAFWKK